MQSKTSQVKQRNVQASNLFILAWATRKVILPNSEQHDLQQRELAEAMLRELQELALECERVEAVLLEEASAAYQAYYDSVAVCCKKWEPVLFGAYYSTAGAAGCACIGGAMLNPLTALVGGAVVGVTVGAVEAASAIAEIERALKSSLPMPTMEENRAKSKSFGNLAESVFRQSKPHRTYSAYHTFTSAGQIGPIIQKYSSAYFCIIGNILFRGRSVDSLRKSLLLCSEQGSTCEWKVD